MPRPRLPSAPRQSRRPLSALPPPSSTTDPTPSPRQLLLHSWAGRLFIVAASLKLIVAIVRRLVDIPGPVEVLSSAATIGLLVSVGYFVWRLFLLMKKRLLWRVRRKLILSYIFIGVVPALLIIGFFMLGAGAVSLNVSAYLFRDGYDEIVDFANLVAAATATEIARAPSRTAEVVEQRTTAPLYRSLSIAFVPTAREAPAAAHAGEWQHTEAPADIPDWVLKRGEGFHGTVLAASPDRSGEVELIARAAAAVMSETRRIGYVVVDVPIDDQIKDSLYQATAVRAGTVSLSDVATPTLPQMANINRQSGAKGQSFAFFGNSVTFLDARDWKTGNVYRAAVANSYTLRELYQKLSESQSALMGAMPLGQAILLTLIVVLVLFLIIEFVALVMGLALARSITSSIHELFMGTERVRHGDFTHRIDVMTNDQLGELAASFNQMIGSIENLLQTAAEKKRLEEELRIARQIQMSLLPRGPLDSPGLSVTALCVPAREVGGDYYDFFRLPDDRIGVLIADVSGKGTSAALYMAELKGLVLSLSLIYQSPRQLLTEVNRIISDNLDARSFITMTYAVFDMAASTMTYARAGHTPLIYLGSGAGQPHGVQILVPNGLVVGLRIPGAHEKFIALLEEQTIALGDGDVIVLYTDGITESMNLEADLFGDTRLSRIVEEHGHLDSGELRERILREIEAFVGTADQHDDMTMILIKVERAIPARVAV
jgi:phosphoserine phosphatase RsbU/P